MASYEIKLDQFEGPLDLLLHLIRKHEMDICNIQIVEITRQYLAYIESFKELNLDLVGEFLLMAATLLHIKSKMLLPVSDDAEDEEGEEDDPRAELVRRLLEYQKYKDAAISLNERPLLDRDVFTRSLPSFAASEAEGEELVPVGLFELVAAMQELLSRSGEPLAHEIDVERLSVAESINLIMERLEGRESVSFAELFTGKPRRQDVVVNFLATLELVKLRLLRIMQNTRCGTLWLFGIGGEDDGASTTEDGLDYA